MYTIELEDVQGYVLREYGNMKFSRFALLKITNRDMAKKWINTISDQLTNAVKVNKDELPDKGLNIAFAKDGLLAMGLSKANLESFSPPFKEGMVTDHRHRLLGDIDSSHPDDEAPPENANNTNNSDANNDTDTTRHSSKSPRIQIVTFD